MEVYSVVASNYEEAVAKARELYGEDIRVQSRREFQARASIFAKKEKRCEIVCYKAPAKKRKKAIENDLREFEKEARTPDPASLTRAERLDTESCREEKREIEKLLDLNLITDPLRRDLLALCRDAQELPSALMRLIALDHQRQVHPRHFTVFLGPTGSGKTTTLAKLAYLYSKQGLTVGIVTLDTYRTGAYEQIKAFGDALSIPVERASLEDELLHSYENFGWKDVILIDTMGLSPQDKELKLRLKGLLSMLDSERTDFMLTVPASMKEEDIEEQSGYYSSFNPSCVIVTKTDESSTIGNLLSFSYRKELPVMFLTNGQRVPEDIEKASSASILGNIKGLGLDMKGSRSQIERLL